jgi:hypothetical protein
MDQKDEIEKMHQGFEEWLQEDSEKMLIANEEQETGREKRIGESGEFSKILYRFTYHTTSELLFGVINNFTLEYAWGKKLPFEVEKLRDWIGLKYGGLYAGQVNFQPYGVADELDVEVKSLDWDPADEDEEIHQAKTDYLNALVDNLQYLYDAEKIENKEEKIILTEEQSTLPELIPELPRVPLPIEDPTDQRILDIVTKDPDITDDKLGAQLNIGRQAANTRRKRVEAMGYKVR